MNRSCNDYEEQTLRQFRAQKILQIEETPLAFADPAMLARHAPLANIRAALRDEAARDLDSLEKAVRGK
jgi:hypothetical protein